eukprot:scpid24297/ scgid6437/ 
MPPSRGTTATAATAGKMTQVKSPKVLRTTIYSGHCNRAASVAEVDRKQDKLCKAQVTTARVETDESERNGNTKNRCLAKPAQSHTFWTQYKSPKAPQNQGAIHHTTRAQLSCIMQATVNLTRARSCQLD